MNAPQWPARVPSGTNVEKDVYVGPLEAGRRIPAQRRTFPEVVKERLTKGRIGESFVTSASPELVRYHAKQAKRRITTQRMSNGCRVWLLDDPQDAQEAA